MAKRVVIIGGVAGGASTAARLRRLDEEVEIIMLERGPHVSFANCGLPYYIGRKIKDKESLLLMTPDDFLNRFNIDVRVKNEAISIDRAKKTLNVYNSSKDENYILKYDILVLSPGASPLVPPIKGLEKVEPFVLRNVPNCLDMEEYVSVNNPKNAVIVGGGYIGLEVAENLAERGIFVTIVELLKQVMNPLDFEMAQFVHQELLMNGVDLILGDGVSEFDSTPNDKYKIKTNSGKVVKTDMLVLSIGIKPESKLAKDAGLEIGPGGHIIVDNHMKTNDPSIFAVGDVIQVSDFVTGKPTAIPLAGPANQQGRMVADIIAGRDEKYPGTIGAAVLKVFDLTIATVGINEKQAKKDQLNYEKIYIHPNNHAGYYPGAQELALKLIFERVSGRILGAQVVGGDGAEKRIDVISTAMQLNGTVFDLQHLQLSYAPPFSSAKDPVNMAGFVASNVLKSDMKIWHWDELDKIKRSDGNEPFFLDVRTKEEYDIGAIKGALHISDLNLRERSGELPQDRSKPIYTYCQVGFRGYLSYRYLIQNGYENVYNLSGGYKTLQMATASIEELKEQIGDPQTIIEEKRRDAEAGKSDSPEEQDIIQVDATGLSCPGPLNELIRAVKSAPVDKLIEIISSDPSFSASANAWTSLTDGVELLSIRKKKGNLVAHVRKTQEEIEITVDESPEHDEIEEEVEYKKARKGRVKPAGEPAATSISIEELYERCCTERGPAIKVDIRPPNEIRRSGGTIPESVVMPMGKLMEDSSKLNEYKDKEVVLFCAVGGRSNMAAQLLAKKGFKDVRSLYGGVIAWKKRGYPMENNYEMM